MNEEAFILRALVCWGLLPGLGLPISIFALRRGAPEFLNKLKVWLVIVPVFLGVLFWGRHAFTALLALCALGGVRELIELGRHPQGANSLRIIWLAALCLPWLGLAYLGGTLLNLLALLALLSPLFGLRSLEAPPPRWLPATAALSLGAGLYFWIWLGAREQGVQWQVVAFSVVTSNDLLSSVFGKFIASPHPFPRLSPRKSWAGYLGGALGALGISFLLQPGVLPIATPTYVFIVLTLIMAGNLGDLLASWIKRGHGRKDFSGLLGSMGGMMDRLDSLLPAGAVLYLMFHLLPPR